MKTANLLKRGCALVLALTMLVGMLSILTTISMIAGSSETPNAEKFVANFSDLGDLLEGVTMKDAVDNTHYEPAYTPASDTSTLDGKINTWMRERFASTTNYVYSTTRAWFAQKSNEISDAEVDGWGKNGVLTGFALMSDGNLRLRVTNSTGANMLRRVDTLIPQFNGENVKLKNFKMTIKYLTYQPNNRGAILVGFDELTAGSIIGEPNVYGELGYRKRVTGSTLVLGNGTGMEKDAARDGWIFYDKKDLISATTVDNQYNTDPSLEWRELKPGGDVGYTIEEGGVLYDRFDTDSTQQWLTLTVEVKNGKATFTTNSEDGYRNETMVKDYDARGGFVSIGMSNRDYVISYVDIEEYDDAGNAVDFGTYHNKVVYGVDGTVEVFSADFTNLPDAHYVNGQYLYNKNHDTSTGKSVGLTATESTTATTVGAMASSYIVNVKDKALVDYLESKFDFFVYGNAAGPTLERWNAAGYFVDANGNNVEPDWLKNGVAGVSPNTGVAGGDWMPGNGVNGWINQYGALYPHMYLSGNKWLQMMNNWSEWSGEPFNIVSYFKVQNSNGNDAVLKNFRLELDFQLNTASATTYPHNQSPIFVKFGGYDSVTKGCTDGAMFAMSYNGGYFLDDLNTSVNGATFTATQGENNVPYYTESVGRAIDSEAHLTLTVKNGTVNAVVTLADGTEVLNVTKTNIAIQSGLIQIGTTYAGIYHGLPYFGGVQVVRLDNEGNPVDFTDGDDDTFEASFVGLTDVMDACYYRNLGTKNNAITLGKVPTGNHWLTNAVGIAAIRNKDNRGYAFDANDPKVVDYLNAKFDFYHAAPNGTLTKMASPYQNADEIYLDASYSGGQWKLAGGRWLRATFFNGVHWNDAYRKQMILVPKLDGEPVKTVDQHLEFDLAHGITDNECSYSAALIMLRSTEVAKTSNAAGEYTDALALRITHSGITVYDGTAPANTNGHPYDDQFLFNGDIYEAHVSIDLEGHQLKIKVTSLDGATVYTDQTVTVENRLGVGYTYFSVCNSDMAFADISVKPIYRENVEAPVGLVGGMETVTGLVGDFSYEYKLKTADEWTAVPANATMISGLEAGTYEVRYAASKYCAASAPASVEVRAGETGTQERLVANFATLYQWLPSAAGESYAFGEADTQMVDYLNTKFDFYHTDLTGKTTKMETPYTGSEDVQTDIFIPGNAHWEYSDNRWLRTCFGQVSNGELFRKYMTIVPKSNGTPVYAYDFETTFDIEHHSAGNTAEAKYGGAIAFTFRSDDVAKLQTSVSAYANATTLVFTRNELVIYDGVTADYKWTDLENSTNRIAWENGTADAARVTVKVVKDKMDIKVTSFDGTVVYYEVTGKDVGRSDKAGYMYFTTLNSDGALADIEITTIKRTDVPAPQGVAGGIGKIVGLSAGSRYEYKSATATEWIKAPEGSDMIMGLTEGGTYEIRYAGTHYNEPGATATVEVRKGSTVGADRFVADFAELNQWLPEGFADEWYAFSTEGTKAEMLDYLAERFDFYHTDLTGTTHWMANPSVGSEDLQTDIFVPGNVQWTFMPNRWLRTTFGMASNGELFRKYMTIVPNMDAVPLYVYDFEATFDIAQHSSANTADAKYGGAVAFTFRSKDVAKLENAATAYADATTLVFTRNELVIYDGVTADFKWTDLESSTNRIAWENGTADTARVTMKVVKDKMDLKVTSIDGATVYYEVVGKDISRATEAGYLYFTTLNSDGALADIEITPIKRTEVEAPQGFTTTLGKIWGFDAGSLYEYRLLGEETWMSVHIGTTVLTDLEKGTYEIRYAETKYSAASAATIIKVENTNISAGSGTVKRFEADFAQLALMARGRFDIEGYYIPDKNDADINTYLSDRFGMFYNNNLRHAEERAYAGQNSKQLESDGFINSWWRIRDTGTLERAGENMGWEMMRKAEMLTLKAPNGNYAQLKNFEAVYTVVDDHNLGAITLSFRSDDYNHVLVTDGYFENQTQLVYDKQETVIIGVDNAGKHGITLGSGDVHARNETKVKNPETNKEESVFNNTLRYIKTEIAALANHDEYTVTVKALGDQLTVVIKATDGSVIWENTDEPYTLERKDAGYMAVSVTNGFKGMKGLVVTQLDDEGNPVDFGTGTRKPASHYDETNTVYYDFSDASQMKDFSTYYLPEWSNLRKPLIETTNITDKNWYVANGALQYEQNNLYVDPTTLAQQYVYIGGTEWQHANEAMVPYTGNLGVAVLNTRTYNNFMLEMDFTGHNLWTQVGFGAGNTPETVYHSNVDGGYNVALAWNADSKTASTHIFYAEGEGTRQIDFHEQFAYNDRGTHKLLMIVSDNKLYVSVDGAEPISVDIPKEYDGGHIYFTLNNPVVVLDNLRIVDLDKKNVLLTECVADIEEQVIDRSKGDRFKVSAKYPYGIDKDGYEYSILLALENEEYRSYKDGSFEFKIGIQDTHGFTLSNKYNETVTITNRINGEFDTASSRRYYFDHPNDFLDFGAYYSELRHDKDYWYGTAEGRDPNGTDEYWSAYKGELVQAENVTDKWQMNSDGTLMNTYYAIKGSASPTARFQDFSTLVLKDVNLLNFRVEMDVKKGDSWWYNFLAVGIQDPTKMYYALDRTYHSTADGGNTGFMVTDETKKGGVWSFLEQEGYINICGNLDGGMSERFTFEPEGYEFIKTYKKDDWHHMVIEVVDGIMSVQVDNSMTYYLVLDNNAIGGYVGLGSYGNNSLFKNFQLTALDADGVEVPMKEAKTGFGAADSVPEFLGWNTLKKLWDFDWLKKHQK